MSGRRRIVLEVNGVERASEVAARTSLADFLRDGLGLTGTHLGCEQGHCGACTVLLDGSSVRSCLVLAVQAGGRRVTTVEGLRGADGGLHPLQSAFRDHHALQCGFCTPGVLMTLVEHLAETPRPTEDGVRRALSGHLCRCTGYQPMVDACLDAARRLARAAPAARTGGDGETGDGV